jgi:hypothetical protein
MPRQAKLDAPRTLREIMIHGINGTQIFRNDQGGENFQFPFSAWSVGGRDRGKKFLLGFW